jgi:tol-pal system protein YbgF
MKKGLIFCLTLSMLFSLLACSSIQPKDDYNDVAAEQEISDTQKKIEELYHRLSVIQFMVDNHQKTIKDLERALAEQKSEMTAMAVTPLATTPKVEKEIPQPIEEASLEVPAQPEQSETMTAAKSETPKVKAKLVKKDNITPESFYDQARSIFLNKDFEQANTKFIQFAKKYPQHDLADNALYWSGECYYAEKNFPKAINTFKAVLKKYPDGSKIPDALLKTGFAYITLKDYDNGRAYLKQVIENYPFSSAGTKAEEKLKQLPK